MRMMGKMALPAALLAMALGTAPARAVTTVLTFDGFACTGTDGGTTDRNCTTSGQWIGADYGSSSIVTVSYDASEATGSRTSLQYGLGGYFTDASGKGYSFPAGPAEELSTITFTPAAGYEVSFVSYIWDKLTATTSADFIFQVKGPDGTVLHQAGNSETYRLVNTAYFAGPITFLFGNGARGLASVDDVTVDVRRIATAPVPELTTWAMMIAGFGLVGSTLRSRRQRPAHASA